MLVSRSSPCLFKVNHLQSSSPLVLAMARYFLQIIEIYRKFHALFDKTKWLDDLTSAMSPLQFTNCVVIFGCLHGGASIRDHAD